MDSHDFDEFEHAFLVADGGASIPLSPSQSFSLSPLGIDGVGHRPPSPLSTLTPAAAEEAAEAASSEATGGRHRRPREAMNAVHMELQENAKLPTFNMTVDRSNATSGTAVDALLGVGLRMRLRAGSCGSVPAECSERGGGGNGFVGASVMTPSTKADINEMLRLSENDLNLTEVFLGEDSRSSAAAAYSNAGALLSSIGTRIGDTSKVIPTDGSSGGGTRTSASTVQGAREDGKHPAAAESMLKDGAGSGSAPSDSNDTCKPASATGNLPVGRGITHAVSASKPMAKADKGVAASENTADGHGQPATLNPHLYNYYPYGRQVPLPIPSPSDGALDGSASESKAAGDLSTEITGESAVTAKAQTTAALPAKDDSIAAAIATAAAIASTQRSMAKGGTQSLQPSRSVVVHGQTAALSARPTADSALKQNENHSAKANPARLKSKTDSTATTAACSSSGTPSTGTTPTTNGAISSVATPPTGQTPPPPAPPYPYIYPPIPYPYHPYQHHHHTALAAAHSLTSASKTEATKKRSQFGFGNNHVVPSVPQPPPKKKTATGVLVSGAAPKKRSAPLPAPPAGNANDPVDDSGGKSGNSGPAYERKKQRAKDARMKLNESIDRLSIAIGVAGSQSRQRAAQLRSESLAPPSDPSSSSSCPIRTFRPATIKGMEDLAAAASAAKKWDRPSFVGTAATLLQSLNSQCEALMRELVELNRVHRDVGRLRSINDGAEPTLSEGLSPRDDDPAIVSGGSCNVGGVPSTSMSASTNESGSSHIAMSPSKRRKLSSDDTSRTTECTSRSQGGLCRSRSSTEDNDFSRILSSDAAFRTILSSLDPQSLARCRCVSRSWNNEACFGQDGPWIDLCVSRFGSANVRQWKDREDDHEERSSVTNTANGNAIKLYQRMSHANVRPPCFYEGNVRLGNAKISGVASAWVSMSERSNGETMRSVKREPIAAHRNIGGYSSLPVVELRILLQNTGISDSPIIVPDQSISVDASTRRRGEQMPEITWDKRLAKKLILMDGSTVDCDPTNACEEDQREGVREMFRLGLFESAILVAHFYVRGCSMTTKFRKRANFVKLLISARGVTVPLVVTFKDDKEGGDEHSIDSHSIEEIIVRN